MPEISLFCGIRITMFYSDHNPPYFHAEYADLRALVDIQEGCVIRGALPARQLKLILAWCELHRDELMQNWELSKDARPLLKRGGVFSPLCNEDTFRNSLTVMNGTVAWDLQGTRNAEICIDLDPCEIYDSCPSAADPLQEVI